MKSIQDLKLILTHPVTVHKNHVRCHPSQEGTLKSPFEGGARFIGWGMFVTFFVFAFLLQPIHLSAQDFSQTITKTAGFTDKSDAGNKFRIINVNGSVTIEAYDGETVELTVTEHIEGTSSEVEQAKKELEYKLERKGSLIIAYLDAPFITLEYDEDGVNHCINRNSDDNDYSFTHDVHVRVPRNILVEGSTMNKGNLSISGTFRKVEARNLNGDVELKNITSQTFASTLNGDVTVSYKKAPTADSKYETLNGTIDVTVPEDLSADIYFQSMQGDFYTDFNNLRRLGPEVHKRQSDRSPVTYRIDKFNPVRIGNGDIDLRFEVLNGDVYLRKRSSTATAGEDRSPFEGGAGG